MLALLLSAALAATPAVEVRLAAPTFSYANLDEKTGDFFVDSLGQQLLKQGAQVISQKEIAAVLGLERQKQLMGCGDDQGSCLAELAGALGVDGILIGSVARTSAGFACNLKVVASSSGKTLAAESVRVKSDDALLDWFEQAAVRVVGDVRKALGKAGGRPEPQPEPLAASGPTPTQASGTASPSATGSALAGSSAPQPSSGQPCEVLWNSKWYPAQILETRADGKMLIRYDGYSATWNEWVSEARIRPPTPVPEAVPLKVAPGTRIQVEWSGNWYDATVLETRADGHAFIKFDGYGDSWNEWVPPGRMRARQGE